MNDKDKLILYIKNSFADVKYPGDANISEYDDEVKVEDFKNKDWQEIPLEILLNSTLPFFTSKGLQYYLPAYMIVSIERHIDSDTIPGDLIGLLAPPDNKMSFRRKSHSLFNREQAYSIYEFLKYLQINYGEEYSTYPLKEAIKYWGAKISRLH